MDSKYKTLLESTVMFSSLTSDDMDIILSLSDQMKFKDGEKIFHIGDPSNQFFIVAEGEVTIRTGEDLGHQTDIARFLAGDSFGDLEFFTAEKRTASAIAVGETQLLGFPDEKTTLSEIMEKWPTISARLLHGFLVRISSRIRKANTFVKSNSLLVQELKRQVYVDKLTGLYNKVFFEETLGKLMKSESTVGLLFYKPDNFKKINDEYGHEAGDKVLEFIAGVLRKNVPDQDLLFRYAGNENVIILPGATRKSLRELAESTLTLLKSLDLSLILPGIDFSLSVSFGLSLYPDNSRDMTELVETFPCTHNRGTLSRRQSHSISRDQAYLMTIDALNSLDVFTTLTPDEVSRIYNKMEHHDVPAGEVLFHEGDPGSLMYIVQSGKVAITVSVSDGEDIEVSQIGEGSFFGEMSIFEKDVRSATCRAIGKCSLLSLDETAFHAIMEEEPKTAIKVMQQMLNTATTRLQNTDGFLSDLVKWGEESRIRAVTDDFTGLYNRRFFDESLEKAVAVSKKNNVPLSLVMMDLDRFGTLNKVYGEAVGDEVLLAIIPVFRSVFDEYDILVRYGGDEFAFILPGKDGKIAVERCLKVEGLLKKIDILDKLNGSFKVISGSIGIAQCPLHAKTTRDLLDKADRALYEAKEAGRGQVSLFGESTLRMKRKLPNNWVKNALLDSFINAICSRNNFLITGHRNPDPDCIASCVAFSLILAKFSKKTSVIINEEHKNDFIHLVDLCQSKNIQLIETPEELEDHYDTIVILDTPKPSMLEFRDEVQSLTKKKGTVSMEIDHHIDADGTYIGNKDYCLVDAVASTCELIAHLSLRLSKKWRLLKQMSIGKLFTQDLLMAVVTGIMSDTHMGKSISNRIEKRHYVTFEKLLNQSLINPSESNDKRRISSSQDIADQQGLLTEDAKACYEIFSRSIQNRNGISYVALNESISDDLFEQFEKKIVTEVAKYTSNILAEENGSFSLVAFYDYKAESDLIQLRMRRNLDFSGLDLRRILDRFKIENGGGHEGAIGFRVPRSQITDLEAFVEMILFGAMDSIRQ